MIQMSALGIWRKARYYVVCRLSLTLLHIDIISGV